MRFLISNIAVPATGPRAKLPISAGMLLKSSFRKTGSSGSGVSRKRSTVEIAASTPAVMMNRKLRDAAGLVSIFSLSFGTIKSPEKLRGSKHMKEMCCLSHPDCTVGYGIAPYQLALADCYRRSGNFTLPRRQTLFI